MNALLVALCRIPGVHARRQNSGNPLAVRADGSVRAFRGAPKGAADIVGIAHPGMYFEVETKSDIGKQTKEQKRWQAMVERHGGLYVLAPRPAGMTPREGARVVAARFHLAMELHRRILCPK